MQTSVHNAVNDRKIRDGDNYPYPHTINRYETIDRRGRGAYFNDVVARRIVNIRTTGKTPKRLSLRKRLDLQEKIETGRAAEWLQDWLNRARGQPGYDEAVHVLRHWQAFAKGKPIDKAERKAVQAILDRAPTSLVLAGMTGHDHRATFSRKGFRPETIGIEYIADVFKAGSVENIIQCQLPECGRWAVRRADAKFCCDSHKAKMGKLKAAQLDKAEQEAEEERKRLGLTYPKRRTHK
jgi:hypothetical protein